MPHMDSKYYFHYVMATNLGVSEDTSENLQERQLESDHLTTDASFSPDLSVCTVSYFKGCMPWQVAGISTFTIVFIQLKHIHC